jgi:hypothetical protein
MSIDADSTARPANPGPVSAVPPALTESVAKAGRHVYDWIAPSVGWYIEHLEDLVHEARAARVAAREKDAASLADVVASLPDVQIVSEKPGRARIRVKALRGQDRLADEVKQTLMVMPGVSQVEVNPLTSSVLIQYDAGQHKSLNSLFQAAKGNGSHETKTAADHDQA